MFWLEMLQIGTFRARYRAEQGNVSNAAVSTIGDGGQARVAKEDPQDLLEA